MNLKIKTASRVLSALAILVTMVAPASAQYILQPTAISSPQGDYGSPYDLPLIISQSGLSLPYVSGTTDFITYTALATHNSTNSLNSGFTGTPGGYPQQITFNLGSAQDINGIAFWAVANPGSVTQFRLFQDVDSDPFNGIGPQLGGVFNPLANGGPTSPAQVFSFGSTNTQFVHMFVDNTDGGTELFPGVGEVAFAAVPEPTTWALMGVAAFVTGAYGWNKRRKNTRNRFAKVK